MKITSEIYQASCDTVRGQDRVKDYTPALRLQDGGRELAVITLSGYKVGHEMSPKDWAARFALCHNMHDDLVDVLERTKLYLHTKYPKEADIFNAIEAILVKVRGEA